MSILLKKVTSTVSVVAIIASAMSASLVANAASQFTPYADALATAGIIAKQSTEAGYNLGNSVTRAEMAKVAVNIKKAAVKPCAGKVFTDVTANLGDLCGYVEAAAEAGLVTKTYTKFRPLDLVTRAEMLKMLLSAKGIAATDEDQGFKDLGTDASLNGFINAAAKAGIINKGIAFNPNNNASRGEAFKVAANSAGLTTTATAESGSDLNLGDLFGDTGTGTTVSTGTTSTGVTSTGTTTTVAAGNLEVALNPASPANGTQVPMSGIIKFAGVDLTAGGADISVNSIEIKKTGLSTVSSTTKVWFEKNGLRISGKASFTSEGNAVVSFAPSYVVKAGSTETLDLYVQLADLSAGTDYQFVSGAITSSAQVVSGSFTTPALRTANYTVANYTATSASSSADYKASNDVVELGAFKIAANKASGVTETRDELFKSITIYQSGSANLTNLSNIVLVRNGLTVSTAAIVSGKALTFTLSDTVKDSSTATYYVKANIVNVENAMDAYQFYLKNTSDINIVEATSGFRANADTATETNRFVSAYYTVNGGDVKFDRNAATPLSVTVAPGTSNVVLMDGTVTAKNAVTLENPQLTISSLSGGGNLSDYFSTLYLKVGNSILSATATGTGGSTIDFLGTVNVSGVATVQLYGTLKSTTSLADATIKFADVTLASFKGSNQYTGNQNNLTSAVGSIPGISVSVSNTTLSVTRNDSLGNTYIAVGSKAVIVYGAQLSSTQGNPVNVTSASFTFTGSNVSSTGYLNNAYATLYVDGTAVSSKTVDTLNSVKFDGFTALVSATKTVDLVVKVDFSDSFTGGDFTTALSTLSAVDSISSKDITDFAKPTGATFTVAQGIGALTASDLTPKTQLLLAGTAAQKLFAFKVTASNDDVTLKSMNFTGTGLNNVSNVRLADASLNQLGVASAITNSTVSFTNLDTAAGSKIPKDQSVIFYVIADVSSNTDARAVALTTVKATSAADLGNSTIKGSNGTLIGLTGAADITSNESDIAQNTAKIALQTPTSKDLATDALEFSITAAGKNSVTLSGATFVNTISGYTGSMMVAIYKKSDGTQVALGTAQDGYVAFNSNVTVDKGTTTTFVVKVLNATVNSAAYSNGWTVSLTNLYVNTGVSTVDLNRYPSNSDTLPLITSK